jgi:hypothetical protein
VVGRGGRNSGEQVVRPANARAREGPRGAVEAAVALVFKEGGGQRAHRRAPTGGDGGHGGAALSCARANAR